MTHRIDFRSKNDLTDAAAIAQVDKNNPAVIAPTVHPTHQDHFFADRGGARLAAVTTALPIAPLIVEHSFRCH
jgi:hypothetical protein